MLAPDLLAKHYSRFKVSERLLLTGHSHQAWPDSAFDAQQQAWLDAAEFVDGKWPKAFEQADRVRAGFAEWLGDHGSAAGEYALAGNTHDLLLRFLSALPFRERRRIVTTDGEFHTVSRQLLRLEEEGIEVVRVASMPADSVGERLAAEVNDRTAAVIVSAVFFDSGLIAGGLGRAAEAAARHGAEILVDVYHALGNLPYPLNDHGLQNAFVTGGGYKYLQLGEGNAFLRFPRDCGLRPVFTGWFADVAALESGYRSAEGVNYGPGPERFGGATYEPVSHYRGAAVFNFFSSQGMTPAKLRERYQAQLALLSSEFDAIGADPALVHRDDVPLRQRAGFLVLRSPRAADLRAGLSSRGVLADHRGECLRLGPAPYLTDTQLKTAMAALREVIFQIGR